MVKNHPFSRNAKLLVLDTCHIKESKQKFSRNYFLPIALKYKNSVSSWNLFEEVQFSNELGTWIYRFTRGTWREGVLEANRTDEGGEMARRVGMFMERFLVPRGSGFVIKTARVYARTGAANRASMLRAVALSQDASDVWGLCFDLVKYFDEVEWPDALEKR